MHLERTLELSPWLSKNLVSSQFTEKGLKRKWLKDWVPMRYFDGSWLYSKCWIRGYLKYRKTWRWSLGTRVLTCTNYIGWVRKYGQANVRSFKWNSRTIAHGQPKTLERMNWMNTQRRKKTCITNFRKSVSQKLEAVWNTSMCLMCFYKPQTFVATHIDRISEPDNEFGKDSYFCLRIIEYRFWMVPLPISKGFWTLH